MKKLISVLLALALVLSVTAVSAFADNSVRGARFVDADGDGICDNRGSGRGSGFVDADGDGICDNRGSGRGSGFVDADGDGICDNFGGGRGAGRGGMRGCRR